jgi:hypothetical protein
MRRVAGGGSTTSRWLSNEGCLHLRKKAAWLLDLARLGWTTAASGTGAQRSPCAGTSSGCGVEKGWLRISLFCSEDYWLRCEMVKFAQSIRIGNR